MALTGVTPTKRVWVDKTEEKGSDVNLAAHLVRDAFRAAFQVAVLITNDSDLAEPVRIVRQELNLPVGILNPHQHHSAELKRVATFLKRADIHEAFLSLGCALICWQSLRRTWRTA
jgi:uncharacterized LabA/DUF88 family protein